MPKARLALPVILTLGLAPSALAGGSGSWIHVRVTEDQGKGTKVNVNLPLSLVDVALASVQDEALAKGRIKLKDKDVSVADLRKMWHELRKSGDAELVTVEDDGQTVHVGRKGDRLQIEVTEGRAGKARAAERTAEAPDEPARSAGASRKELAKVSVDLPISLVDALLGGEGDELDLKAAIAELGNQGPGEFIRIDDRETQVRVWVDDHAN